MEKISIDDSISLGINIGAMNTVYSRFLKKEGKFQSEVLLSDTSSRTIPSQICYSDNYRLYGDTAESLMKKFSETSYSSLSRLIGYIHGNDNIYKYEEEFLNKKSLEKGDELFKIYNNEKVKASIIIADYLNIINNYYFNEKNIKYNNCTLSVPDYYTAHQKQLLKICLLLKK